MRFVAGSGLPEDNKLSAVLNETKITTLSCVFVKIGLRNHDGWNQFNAR